MVTYVAAQGWIKQVGGARGAVLPAEWGVNDLLEHGRELVPGDRSVVYALDSAGARPRWTELCPDGVQVTGGGDGEPAWRWQDERGHVVVYVPHDVAGVAGPWEGMTAGELLQAFAAFERLVGVPWGESVGRTAEALILKTHPIKKGGRTLDAAPVTPAEIRGGALEQPYGAWKRDLTAAEQAARYLHAFDANSQYLGAWGVTHVGHGPAQHLTGPLEFDAGTVGFWRVPGLDRVPNLEPLLPHAAPAGREWFSTPTVARVLECSDGLDVPVPIEAYVWPERSRFFQKASERLRDARTEASRTVAAARGVLAEVGRVGSHTDGVDELRQVSELISRQVAAEAVLDAVKAMYRVETGRLGAGRRPGSGWARPDWGHLIRATARTNLHRKLSRLTAKPFAIATDGLLFATDEPDAVKFATGIGLAVGPDLGQFSYEGSADRLDLETLAAVVEFGTLTPARMFQILKK